ncbi:MAG TPA: hypothetical protein VH280_01370 [Verrucomicrobiae bacterium]|jgi:hypothetical protein|nr:hypothetical protein [Verrucomicrobiae bacterium]
MKLGYKYYRSSLIKLMIYSIVILGVFWGHLRGRGNPNDEPGALIFVGVLMIVGNVGLFILMLRAKRKEQTESLKARVSYETKHDI